MFKLEPVKYEVTEINDGYELEVGTVERHYDFDRGAYRWSAVGHDFAPFDDFDSEIAAITALTARNLTPAVAI